MLLLWLTSVSHVVWPYLHDGGLDLTCCRAVSLEFFSLHKSALTLSSMILPTSVVALCVKHLKLLSEDRWYLQLIDSYVCFASEKCWKGWAGGNRRQTSQTWWKLLSLSTTTMKLCVFEQGDKAGRLLAQQACQASNSRLIPKIKLSVGSYTSDPTGISKYFSESCTKLYISKCPPITAIMPNPLDLFPQCWGFFCLFSIRRRCRIGCTWHTALYYLHEMNRMILKLSLALVHAGKRSHMPKL